MKLSKKFVDAVQFARFCQNHKVDALDLAELMTLIARRVSTATKSCNIPDYPEKHDDNAIRRVTQKAKSMGFTIDSWPGFYPSIKDKNGFVVYLPW